MPRSLQSLDSGIFPNNDLMMAEINFLEAKRQLAEAHAAALKSQYIRNHTRENGFDSQGGSDLGSEASNSKVVGDPNNFPH